MIDSDNPRLKYDDPIWYWYLKLLPYAMVFLAGVMVGWLWMIP